MKTYEIQVWLNDKWQPYMQTTGRAWKRDLARATEAEKSPFPNHFADEKLRAVKIKKVRTLRILA